MSDAQLGKARRILTQWHPNLRKPTKITQTGLVKDYVYDSRGNLLSETSTDTSAGTPVVRTRSWTYNANNLLTSSTDEAGSITAFTYDALGFMASSTDPMGRVTQYTHDGAGRMLSVVGPDGLQEGYTYDIQGRVLSYSSGTRVTTMSYSPAGLLASVVQPNGYSVTYRYNPAHRMIGWNDNRGNQGDFVLDSMGNRISETVKDAQSQLVHQIQREMNSANEIASETVGSNQLTSFVYDSRLSLVNQTDGLNQTTTYDVDDRKRRYRITNPLNAQASVSHNNLDAVVQATDYQGIATDYTRDAQGNATQEASPDIGTQSSSFDPRGLANTSQDAAGRTQTITRDALGRPTGISYSSGTGGGSSSASTSFVYE
jgi:YD repeat-containing protein